VALPLCSPVCPQGTREKVATALARVGLVDRAGHWPGSFPAANSSESASREH